VKLVRDREQHVENLVLLAIGVANTALDVRPALPLLVVAGRVRPVTVEPAEIDLREHLRRRKHFAGL
jgi:hypothetical protein